LVVDPGSPQERILSIRKHIFVGRECAGVDGDLRVLIDDDSVSRTHCEIRLDIDQDRAFLIDTSTNGTRVNGTRVERATAVQLRSGDRIDVGNARLEFRTDRFVGDAATGARETVANVYLTRMAMVVGDVISYSTVSEYTDTAVLMANVRRLYGELSALLSAHKGSVNNFVGDAFFAVWELEHIPSAVEDAVAFALEARRVVARVSPALDLRDPAGNPIRMGWAVSVGLVAVSTVTGMLVALGDATNLVFRLSGLAGRYGRGEVVVTDAVRMLAGDRFRFDNPEDVIVKGRTATERIYTVSSAVEATN
jgi:class 3 adenylate cyclase